MKIRLTGLFTFLAFMVLLPLNTSAVPATPFPVKITQPDGSVITVRIHGDEFFNYKTTLDGYPLIPDNAGILNYAILNSTGNLVSTSVKASEIANRTSNEESFIKKLSPNLNLTNFNKIRRAQRAKAQVSAAVPQKSYPLTGSHKSIVILVNFTDKSFVTASPKTAYTNLLNQTGYSANGGTGSANDYFNVSSNGVFSPQFDVVGPFNLPNNMAFYGANDPIGNDMNAQQMIVDACTAAFNSGVNFSQYDTDNDGIVDNVFVYYAGYNEAEGGPANSVWPHRWGIFPTSIYTGGNYSGSVASVTFNGKRVLDYACTSELRGNSGSNMCGVGTFCHEFGHVLGLDDLYNTNNDNSYNTLSYWDIMDSGPYLNLGRTPPTYSSYERFFLNWLVPTELKQSTNVTVPPLISSNKAFLISETGNHNLNGANPSPVEFFMLENRQKTGWDTYLPGHGMLITHIFYDPATWENNTPNNNVNAMGIDIVEADGIASDATLAGDPFPGTSNVTFFQPVLRNNTILKKPITQIRESFSRVSFKFMDGSPSIETPIAYNATEITFHSFIANWGTVKNATGYYLSTYKISNGSSTFVEGFDNGLATPPDWTLNLSNISNTPSYSGTKTPALQFSNSGEFVQTEKYMASANKLSFYIRSIGANNGGFLIEAQNDLTGIWSKVDSISILNSLNENARTYTFNESQNFTRFKFTYLKGIGSITFDDVSITLNKDITIVEKDKWVTSINDTVSNLEPSSNYVFKVKASNIIPDYIYEDVTNYSNLISTTTLNYPVKRDLISVPENGNLSVYLPNLNDNLYVFNSLGQSIKIIKANNNPIVIKGLQKGEVYILKYNTKISKVIL